MRVRNHAGVVGGSNPPRHIKISTSTGERMRMTKEQQLMIKGNDETSIRMILDNLNTIINEYFFGNEKGMPSDAEAKSLSNELKLFIKEK